MNWIDPIETIDGHTIRPAKSRWGRLFAVIEPDGVNRMAFFTLNEARTYAGRNLAAKAEEEQLQKAREAKARQAQEAKAREAEYLRRLRTQSHKEPRRAHVMPWIILVAVVLAAIAIVNVFGAWHIIAFGVALWLMFLFISLLAGLLG